MYVHLLTKRVGALVLSALLVAIGLLGWATPASADSRAIQSTVRIAQAPVLIADSMFGETEEEVTEKAALKADKAALKAEELVESDE